MVQRVVNEHDAYSTQMVNVVRLAGLIVPVIIIIYGSLAYFNLVAHSPIFSLSSFLAVAILFIAIRVFEISISRQLYARLLPYLLGAYTLLAAAYAIWIGGFESPAVYSWIVLLIACDLYYGKVWLWVNAGTFLATSVVAYLMIPGEEPISTLVRYMSVAIFVSVIGAVIGALRSVQVAEHKIGRAHV